MNRHFKVIIFFIMILAQIVINKFADDLKFTVDFFFLILIYISIQSNYLKTIILATIIGLITDFTSGSLVIGVFGFSRTVVAYILNEIAKFIDLKKNIFVFLLIAISLSLSNFIANIFFYFILKFTISLNMVLYQPLLTGFVGFMILIPTKIKQSLNVY